jgi:hypothetical protein
VRLNVGLLKLKRKRVMGNVNMCVFKPFFALYGHPKTENEDLFLELYEQTLQGFSDDVLDQAVQRIKDRNEYRSWPMPGAVANECRKIKPAPVFSNFTEDDPEWRPPTPEEKERANRLVDLLKEFVKEKEIGKPDPKRVFARTSRPEFEQMQYESPNWHLHMTEYGIQKWKDTGRKPHHRPVNLADTDHMRQFGFGQTSEQDE